MNLGFVGLGAMGALIVPRLMAAGHKVVGWNRSRDKAEALIKDGMGWADTPRAVAEQSDIVFSIVTDSKAVKSVALGPDGIVSGLKKGGIYIVIDHASAPGAGTSVTESLHRMDPEAVKAEVQAVGFQFVGDSKVVAHPGDDHMSKIFDGSIRGKTDQFVLKFKKP